MIYEAICTFLKSNNEQDFSKFELQDNSDGEGIFISKWDYENIQKPALSDLQNLVDALSLSKAKDIKKLEIETQRKLIQYANVVYNGVPLLTSEKARSNLEKAESYARRGDADSIYILAHWLDANNNLVVLTVDDAFNVIKSYSLRDNMLYFKEAQLKAEVSACTTVENVLNKNGTIKTKGVNGIVIDFSL